MRSKEATPGKASRQAGPVDLKYGQTVTRAGEYQCSRCGHVNVFRREDVAGKCRECGGAFYYSLIHKRK